MASPWLQSLHDRWARSPQAAGQGASVRAAAFARALDRDLPNRRLEDWRYLDLRALASGTGEPATAATAASIPAILGELRIEVTPAGARFPDALLEQVRCITIRRLPSLLPEATDSAWGDLAVALAPELIQIDVRPGVVLNAPIHVVHHPLTAGAAGAQLVIRLGAGAAATLVESYPHDDQPGAVRCLLTAIELDPQAELEHVTLRDLAPAVHHWAETRVHSQAGARYRAVSVSTGGAIARDALQVTVAGPGADTTLHAAYLPAKDTTIDHHTLIDHLAPDCTSRQLYKGIVRDNGHAVFNGKVMVRQAAQRTNAEQLSNCLMLDPEAVVDAKPQLEIFADDVRCTHGATVGQLRAEELFYMSSRAIPQTAARRLLLRGFAAEVLSPIENADVATLARAVVARALRD